MPLYNWIKCNKGELIFVRKKVVKSEKQTLDDEIVWKKIYDNYIDEFGLNKLHLRLLKVAKEKALLELEYVLTGDNFKLTEIKLEEQRLKEMIDNNKQGMTTEQSLVYMSKWLGYHLNSKKITVREYFDIINEYGKQNKTE
jgi:hypothetical protein|tara:strand:- start:17261 stop:17683 length:423 start_codon:yes stop_codon:yes gene_type:complete